MEDVNAASLRKTFDGPLVQSRRCRARRSLFVFKETAAAPASAPAAAPAIAPVPAAAAAANPAPAPAF